MSFLTQAQRIILSSSKSNKVFESQTIFTKKLPIPILAATIELLDKDDRGDLKIPPFAENRIRRRKCFTNKRKWHTVG